MRTMYYLRLPMLIAALSIAAFATGPRASAQLTISPNGILMKPAQTSGEVEVRNAGDKAMVVTARLMYAILRTDSAGAAFKDTIVTGAPDQRSAVEWMRAFPRQFTLAPGASRAVKVLSTPPDSLAEGEWLARLEIKGRPVDKPAQLEPDTTQIGVRLNYTYAYSFPAVFHKGVLTTGLDFTSIDARQTDGGPAVMLRLRVSGNCTYRGTFFATLTPANGGSPTTFELPIVATVDMDYPLALPNLEPGTYALSLRAATRRRGDSGDHLVTAPAVTKEFSVTLRDKSVTVAAR